MLRARLGVVCVLVCLVAASAMAATYVVPEDAVLAGKAEAIVVGAALTSFTEVAANGRVYTVTEFSVTEVIKGSPKLGRQIRVTSPGGVYGEKADFIFGAPRFQDGERMVLFINSSRDGKSWGTTDLALGVFSFAADNAGRQVLVRDEGEIVGTNTKGETHVEQRRSAPKFVAYLRELAAGGSPKADYYVAFSPLVAKDLGRGLNNTPQENGAFSAHSYTSDSFNGTGRGARWNTFPTQSDWRNQNTLSNGAARSVEVIQLGLAPWTNDCQSNANYAYVGTTASTQGLAGSADGVNSVIFERNLNNIPGVTGVGTYSCAGGGVVALGGWSAPSGGTNSHDSSTFWSITEGDVEFNQGINACPSYFNGGDFVTAAVHEFGHTLGMRHANQTRTNNPGVACATDASLECSNTAVMNSTIVNGYNGALQSWDLNALRSLYPSTCSKPNGDFNNSGNSDLLWRKQSTGENAIWLMNGAAVASSAFITSLPDPWAVQGIGDFNGDSNADIFWRNPQTLQAAIWFMNGTTVSSGAFVATPNADWAVMGIGDFNGNGRADILWRNSATSEAVVWLMNGANIDSTGSVAFPPPQWVVDGVGDFNGNGMADILWRNTSTSQSAVWLMNGAAISNAAYIATPPPEWSVKGVGDFNADGKADLFWRNGNTFQSVIWLMDGLAILNNAYTPTANSQWQVQAVGDFNANGRADLVWRNTTTGENAMWFMNGVNLDSSTLFTPLGDLGFNIAGPR